MEKKAKQLGIGGKMRYLYPNGHNYGLDDGPIATIQKGGVDPTQVVGDMHVNDGGPTPGNIYVNLGVFARRCSTVADRFSGSWCRFPESCGSDGGNGEKTWKKRGKMGEKLPKKSGGKLT